VKFLLAAIYQSLPLQMAYDTVVALPALSVWTLPALAL
jgi:hypothetical protein